jgi:hypothetical protein
LKKSLFVLILPIIFTAVGCGTTPSSTSPKVHTTPKKSVVVDPKVSYVQDLNNIQIKTDLKVISEYGKAISSLDETNENDVQALKDFEKTGIPKYKSILSDLNNMKVPDTYKPFHKLLTQSISDFAVTMQEMELHLKTKGDTTHLAKATANYTESTNDIVLIAKKLPFGQLK